MGLIDALKNLIRPYEGEDEEFQGAVENRTEFTKPVSQEPPQVTTGAEVFSQTQEESPRPRLQMPMLKPKGYEAAKEIGGWLRSRRALVVDLDGTPQEATRRLADFMAGAAYVIEADIRRLTRNAYLIVPPGADLGGELWFDPGYGASASGQTRETGDE